METLLFQIERKCINSVSVQSPDGEELLLLLFTCLLCYCSVGWGFFVVVGSVVFFLINNFWKLDNLGQPLVIVKFCIRVHVKYSETCQEMLGKNWKE